MSATYRYPGVKPFEATDAALFFGRERDQADLRELVRRESLIVLFGRSGYGKSSLVKAGLIPDLADHPSLIFNAESGEEKTVPNCPVYVRFNLYSKASKSRMPCDALIERFREKVGEDDADAHLGGFLERLDKGQTLWNVFRASKTAAEQQIYLIFDQFEEFFSYPVERQAQFRQELSELLYTRIPQKVRDAMDDLDPSGQHRLHLPLEVHALFIIRSDRLHLLNSMREELPAILRARYELKALNEQQARDAIVRPAQLSGGTFWLQKPFTYEPAALAKILYELAKPSGIPYDQEEQHSIEAFQLQMVCQTIEQSLINRTHSVDDQPTVVREADLPDFGQIYEQYYTDKLTDLPDKERRLTAHILLEEVMVIGEGFSDIRRVSIDKDLLVETMQRDHHQWVSQELLNYLEDKFLIRRESIGGRVHYEISHDVLLAPLLKSRDEARQRAARAQAEAEEKARQLAIEERIKEAQAQAEEERRRRQEADRRRRRAGLLALVSIAGFVLAAIAGSLATRQKAIAQNQKAIAEMALKRWKDEEKRNVKRELYQTIDNVEIILKSPDGCPDTIQRLQLDSLTPLYKEDVILQKRVEGLKTLIRNKNCQ